MKLSENNQFYLGVVNATKGCDRHTVARKSTRHYYSISAMSLTEMHVEGTLSTEEFAERMIKITNDLREAQDYLKGFYRAKREESANLCNS
jgi:hypothetical protein